MQFQRELLSLAFFDEILPLIHKHYKEIAHFQDIKLEPDYEQYLKLDQLGMTRVYTAREEDRSLIGYAVFFVRKNIHYKSSTQAVQDIIFISPEKRGFGYKFITWCDRQLKDEGVQVVYHHVKKEHNFGPMLTRMGYQEIDHIYGKRLDGENL